LPFLERIGRLHVVMAVEEQCGLAGRAEPFAINQRIALAFDELGRIQADRAKLGAHEFGGATDIGLVLGERGDAGNAQECFETVEECSLVLLVVVHAKMSPALRIRRAEDYRRGACNTVNRALAGLGPQCWRWMFAFAALPAVV